MEVAQKATFVPTNVHDISVKNMIRKKKSKHLIIYQILEIQKKNKNKNKNKKTKQNKTSDPSHLGWPAQPLQAVEGDFV